MRVYFYIYIERERVRERRALGLAFMGLEGSVLGLGVKGFKIQGLKGFRGS